MFWRTSRLANRISVCAVRATLTNLYTMRNLGTALALAVAAFGAAQNPPAQNQSGQNPPTQNRPAQNPSRPATPIGQIRTGQAPVARPQAPVVVENEDGTWYVVNGLRYRIAEVRAGLSEYTERYNQIGANLVPGYLADQLVVVVFEVENTLEVPTSPVGFFASVIDTSGSISETGRADVRQASFVSLKGGMRTPPIASAEMAPLSRTKFAMVFSIPKTATPTGLRLTPARPVNVAGKAVMRPIEEANAPAITIPLK